MTEIDRQGIGMLYAGGVGIIDGSLITYGWDPTYAVFAGVLVTMLGITYHINQRMGARS
jgi:hypothetical protein